MCCVEPLTGVCADAVDFDAVSASKKRESFTFGMTALLTMETTSQSCRRNGTQRQNLLSQNRTYLARPLTVHQNAAAKVLFPVPRNNRAQANAQALSALSILRISVEG